MASYLRILIGLFVLAGGAIALRWWSEDRLEHSQDQNIRTVAARYRLEPSLIKAIVWKESRFNPQVRGKVGELGLMQLREEAAQEWADQEQIATFDHSHCTDPVTNLLAGTYYLAKLMRRYTQTDNPVPYALADYNAGRSNVLRWNKGEASTNSAAFIAQIGFPGTRDYILSIMSRQDHYRDFR